MKFQDLLLEAINRSEIPLRFEPGADEAVAAPVAELIRAWLLSHAAAASRGGADRSGDDAGRRAVIDELLQELDGVRDVPA
jgi:hypothetical protein